MGGASYNGATPITHLAESMSEKTKTKNDATRTINAWQANAVQLLQEKGVDFSRPTLELGRRIEAMIVARAYAESQDKPKLAFKYEYAPALFTEGRGPGAGESVASFMPRMFIIHKMFIPFSDQSVMVLSAPSQETMMFGKYCAMLGKNESLASSMGIKLGDLRLFKQIMELATESARVAPMSTEEMDGLIARESALSQVGARALVQVNLSPTKVPLNQAMGILTDFLGRPTDTVTHSVEQLIQKEFGARK